MENETSSSMVVIEENKIFQSFLRENINQLIRERQNRPSAREGFCYKRDWYDKMSDNLHLSKDFFLKNINSIWNKTSNLPSIERKVILFCGDKSLNQTVSFYEDLKKEMTEGVKNILV